jgi:predicted RNA-binding Zn-ribbon protein involved in translation (DUF1610 family)
MVSELLFQAIVIAASVASILLVIGFFYWISKRRYKKPETLPFCPNCGSTALLAKKKDINESYFVGSLHSNHAYACQNCGFVGSCPFGTPEEIAEYVDQKEVLIRAKIAPQVTASGKKELLKVAKSSTGSKKSLRKTAKDTPRLVKKTFKRSRLKKVTNQNPK